MTISSDDRLDIEITRTFNAPPELVFAQWMDADALKDWFAPGTYTGTVATVEAKVGGAWRVEFTSPQGKVFIEHGVYREIVPNQRIVMTLHQSGGDALALIVTVSFEPQGEGTLMRFQQSGFTSTHHRDAVAEGWRGCFDKLQGRVEGRTSEDELRELFQNWFAASERKDLDQSMDPISDTIVSYEHSMPLEVRDLQQMRQECQVGFDRARPQFRWDIPDLQVIVRGDIAVTWGLNRMADYENGEPKNVMWSRGTRIFQLIDGRWKMIHQHVSFPMDPGTGAARFDLVPGTA